MDEQEPTSITKTEFEIFRGKELHRYRYRDYNDALTQCMWDTWKAAWSMSRLASDSGPPLSTDDHATRTIDRLERECADVELELYELRVALKILAE